MILYAVLKIFFFYLSRLFTFVTKTSKAYSKIYYSINVKLVCAKQSKKVKGQETSEKQRMLICFVFRSKIHC